MESFPKIFSELVKELAYFPGIGRRSAERIAFHILKMKPEEVKNLTHKIEKMRSFIHPCKLCNNFSSGEICSICSDPRREKEAICIVEEPKDIIAIERTGQYRGLYYCLLGAISPLEGIGEEGVNLEKLLSRIRKGEIKEVIISTDPDNDGELTSQFIIKTLSPYKLKIYRLAIGIPLGMQIEYIDASTLGKALLEKKLIAS